MWHSFSTDPSWVANYKEIRRGHVNFMLIWYGMTHHIAGYFNRDQIFAFFMSISQVEYCTLLKILRLMGLVVNFSSVKLSSSAT